MIKICISGSSGFVGKNLYKYLEKDKYAFTHLQLRGELNESKIIHTDAVIHLAGKAHDLKIKSDPDEYRHVNFEITKKLYGAFLRSEASKFIFISSVKAVADSVEEGFLDENHLPSPQTDYGKSKLMAEEYIKSCGLPASKSYYILRPCMIQGPGNKGNLNLLFNVVKKGIPYPLAAFDNKRSFLSVENLCFVIKELIERKDIASGVYHIADDIPLSTNRIIQVMAETLSIKARVWLIPRKWIKLIARIGDWLHLPLTTERLQKLTENYVVSNKKLVNAIGKPLPVSSEDGLRTTIQSFMHDE